MPKYMELKEQAERLLAQAEELREREIADAIADIKAKIKAYGLTARDIGLAPAPSAAPRAKSVRASRSKAPAKYRGPNGETWSGGRGRKPRWVVDALAKGRKLEDFRV